MPKYRVTLVRTKEEATRVEIAASNEIEAAEMAIGYAYDTDDDLGWDQYETVGIDAIKSEEIT